jgi:tRNA-splicing ligase RtcB
MPADTPEPIVHQWLVGKLPRAAATLIDRLRRAPDVVRIAILPDVHAATDICVGCAVATHRLLYPAAVGGDIGCGIATLAFDADAADLLGDESRAMTLLATLRQSVPPNRHPHPRPLPPDLAQTDFADARLAAVRRDAAVQLGTLGRGNHFLELQADEEGRLWAMVHSGSRAVGPAVRELYASLAGSTPIGLAELDADSPAGRAYLADLAWSRRYAAANRDAMLDATADLLQRLFHVSPTPDTPRIECDHNHVQLEPHFGQRLWVHRKGAAPAAAGQLGLIPGSMASRSFHVEGRGHPDSLCSSSHGAGRALSRDEARRRITPRDLHRQLEGVWFDPTLARALRDEAPSAYKDIGQVMRAQRELVRIVRTLRPILCYKAGS